MRTEPVACLLPDRPPAATYDDRPPLHASGFVGRDAELARLRLGIGAAQNGAGSFFLISGDPGIGKTRLATEFASEAAANGFSVLWGRCWEAGGAPSYWPWVQILRTAAESPEVPAAGELGRHADYLAHVAPEIAAKLGSTPGAASPPADPDSARFFVFDAVATLLRSLAARRPLLVIIDDFHAADRVSVLLLAFVARVLRDHPLVLVGTYRDVEAGRSPQLVEPLAELNRFATRISLAGLTAGDVAVLLSGLGGRPASSRLVDRIHRLTDGNPFFVDEIVRLLRTEDWRVDGPLDAAFRIPDGVRETVRRRLAQLTADNRSVLEVAAVVGRDFDGGTISVALALDHAAVLEALSEPIRSGLVQEVSRAPARFSFHHALIREVIYEDLPPAHRLELHQRIADGLVALTSRDPDRYVAELAHHFLIAAPSSSDDRFIGYATRAARHAMRRMAFEEAIDLLERTLAALVHASPDERRRCELYLALAEAKEWATDVAGCRAAAEHAAAIARRIGAPDLFARAALATGAVEAIKSTATSRCEAMADLLYEALQLSGLEETPVRARLQSRLALHYLSHGDRPSALQFSRQAVFDARESRDRETLVHALISRHAVLFGPDAMDERLAIATEILELARLLGSREFMMRALALRVTNALELGDMRSVDEGTQLHRHLAEQSNDPFERWASLMWRTARELLSGRFDSASALSLEGFELSRTMPGPQALDVNGPTAFAGQQILIQEARYGGVPDLDVITRYRTRYPEILVWQVAHLHRATRLGLAAEVRRELEALGLTSYRQIERNGTWLAAMAILSEAVFVAEDRLGAAELYDLLLPFADRNVTISFVTCRGSVGRLLGLLATTLGNLELASGHFEQALRMNRKMGAWPQVAVTLYEHAGAVARLGDETTAPRATEMLHEARRIAAELDMKGLDERCCALLARLGAPDDEPQPTNAAAIRLTRDGEIWTLARGSASVLLKNAKGLAYLAELVRHPGRDVHVLDLIALFADATTGGSASESRARASASHFAADVTDQKALRAYRTRLHALSDELGAAESAGDPEAAVAAREEIASLERELARATALGGRPRRASDVERARISVTRTLRLAIARIVDVAPELGAELARRVRTGTFCCFTAEDGRDAPTARRIAGTMPSA